MKLATFNVIVMAGLIAYGAKAKNETPKKMSQEGAE